MAFSTRPTLGPGPALKETPGAASTHPPRGRVPVARVPKIVLRHHGHRLTKCVPCTQGYSVLHDATGALASPSRSGRHPSELQCSACPPYTKVKSLVPGNWLSAAETAESGS